MWVYVEVGEGVSGWGVVRRVLWGAGCCRVFCWGCHWCCIQLSSCAFCYTDCSHPCSILPNGSLVHLGPLGHPIPQKSGGAVPAHHLLTLMPLHFGNVDGSTLHLTLMKLAQRSHPPGTAPLTLVLVSSGPTVKKPHPDTRVTSPSPGSLPHQG